MFFFQTNLVFHHFSHFYIFSIIIWEKRTSHQYNEKSQNFEIPSNFAHFCDMT